MGFATSKQQLALKQAKSIRDNLYTRIDRFYENTQLAINEINADKKIKILNLSAIEIADLLDNKQTTSLEVLYIFIQRTVKVGVRNNYVFDEMFEQAVTQALLCDQKRKKDNYEKKCWRAGMNHQTSYPPFYGVPTSVKQTMIMKNKQTHVGFVSRVNPLSQHDGLFAMMIRKMGFIPFVRSNVPQACKTFDTNNNIFGYCKNPWNKNRTCGGSSGGESGMVSSNSAPIGFGSDLGGSLRIPSAFTGLATLKIYNRYSRLGNCYYGKFTGGLPYKAELGPITKNVDDLILIDQYLFNPQNYNDIPLQFRDPYIKHIPFNEAIINEKQKFKIGVAKRFKSARACKSIERAINSSAQILQQNGHQIIDVDLQKVQKLYFFMVHLLTFDQKLYIFNEFKGNEPLTVEYKIVSLFSKIPWFIRRIIGWFIAKKQPRLAQMIKQSRPNSAIGIFERIYKIQKIIAPQIYKIFAKNNLDAVIMPTFVAPAPLLGQIGKLQYFYSFTAAWNVINYPAGVLPITTVQQNQIEFQDQFNDFYTNNMKKSLIGSQGMPISVQIVSTPYNEQKILAIMKQLEKQVKFRDKHRIPQ